MLRRELESRWLVLASAGAACGVWSSRSVFGFVALLLLALGLSRPSSRLTLLVLACSGWLLAPRTDYPMVTTETKLRGMVDVLSIPRSSVSGESVVVASNRGRFIMRYSGPHDIGMGDRLLVSGDLAPIREGSEEFWQERGVVASLKLDAPPVSVERGALVWRLGNGLRSSFQAFVSHAMGRSGRPVVEALCFNQDAELPDALKDSLQRTGTVHIISTSGLHVVFLAGLVTRLLSWLPVPRWTQLFLLACVLLVYASAAGLRPPALRAIVMVVVFMSAYLGRREPDALSALGAAFLASFLWTPSSVLDPGLQLSFATLGSLVLFANIRQESYRGVSGWFASTAKATAQSSLVASVASAPLTSYYFGYLSIIAVLANVLIFPAVLGILVVGLGAFVLSLVWGGPAELLMKVFLGPLAAYLEYAVKLLGSWPWSALYTPPFSGYWLPATYGLGLLLWRPRARPE